MDFNILRVCVRESSDKFFDWVSDIAYIHEVMNTLHILSITMKTCHEGENKKKIVLKNNIIETTRNRTR